MVMAKGSNTVHWRKYGRIHIFGIIAVDHPATIKRARFFRVSTTANEERRGGVEARDFFDVIKRQ